jgi:hypothetical protein
MSTSVGWGPARQPTADLCPDPPPLPDAPLKSTATTYRFRLVVDDSAGVMSKVCGFLVVP